MKKKTYNNNQRAALANAFGKSLITIDRWIRLNDDRLTSDRAKVALKALKALKKLPVVTSRESLRG